MGQTLPNPLLIHWLARHGHGIGNMAWNRFQTAAPAFRGRQFAPMLNRFHPICVFHNPLRQRPFIRSAALNASGLTFLNALRDRSP